MNMKLKRSLTVVLATLLIVGMCFVPKNLEESFGATNTNTKSLGALVQSYKSAKGTFKLTKKSRFYVVSSSVPKGSLKSTVSLIDSEFAAKGLPSKTPLKIVYGDGSNVRTGDIVVKLVSKGFSAQQYTLSVGKKAVVTAGTTDGLFYGLRTLMQYRITSQSNTLARCTIKDKPDASERTAHLDCARKYFSKSWIKNFIKKISWQRYNAIEIHFSEDQGLRLQSKKFPWLAGTYNDSHGTLSQKDMIEICNTAKKYHVEIIPSFDSPGHMNYVVERYKEYLTSNPKFSFTYKGKRYSASSKGFKNISNYFMYKNKKSGYNHLGIDISNPTAVAFTSALIDEYADFFKKQGCTEFNIGGDELLGWDTVKLSGRTFKDANKWYALQHWDTYAKNTLKIKNGNSRDAFISYMNATAKRLEAKGYKCRVWNDEINRFKDQHINLKKSVKIVYWSNDYANLNTLKKKGYKFYNAMSDWTYYVTYTTAKSASASQLYNSWKPNSFSNIGKAKKIVSGSQFGGGYFCIWCDYASHNTMSDVWNEVSNKMWSSGTKLWNTQINTKASGTKKAVSYTNFKKLVKRLGDFPGYSKRSTKNSVLPSAAKIKAV